MLYLLYYEGDDFYNASDAPKLLGVFSNGDEVAETMIYHANTFRTNDGQALDFRTSKVCVDVVHGRYFSILKYLNKRPDYGMRTN